MRKLLHILTILMVAYAVGACSCSKERQQPEEEAVVSDTMPRLIMQVQQCSRLYTAEYHIHKIVTHDDVVRLKGNFLRKEFDIPLPLGERKVAIPMDATLKAYIDFSGFSEKNVERDGRRITIVLPDPQIVLTSSKINQQEVKTYVGLTRSHFTDRELTAYEQQGRQAILNSAADMGIVQTAQENATRVLVPMLVEMGYREQDVTIAFRHDLNIRQLINSSIEKK